MGRACIDRSNPLSKLSFLGAKAEAPVVTPARQMGEVGIQACPVKGGTLLLVVLGPRETLISV